MVVRWPLPSSDKQTVAQLPVMHRLQVRMRRYVLASISSVHRFHAQIREQLMADKVRQNRQAVRQALRDADYERYVCFGGQEISKHPFCRATSSETNVLKPRQSLRQTTSLPPLRPPANKRTSGVGNSLPPHHELEVQWAMKSLPREI